MKLRSYSSYKTLKEMLNTESIVSPSVPEAVIIDDDDEELEQSNALLR